MKNRTKVALGLFLFFLIGRGLDIFATHYYSPALDYERNPLVLLFGGGWSTITITQIVGLVACILLCLRMAYYNYHALSLDEKLERLFAKHKPAKTPIQRYVFDFCLVFGFGLGGVLASLVWYIAHGLQIDWFNEFIVNPTIFEIPVYAIPMVAVCILLGKSLGQKIAMRGGFLQG